MSISSRQLKVRGIDVDVVYKDIKHLHIAVYPPAGRVRVASPLRLSEDQVRLAVVRRLAWIQRQREQLRAAMRQTAREVVTGESHYVWGRRYRLKCVERQGRSHFEIDGERLVLFTPGNTTAEQRRAMLECWYRDLLRDALPDLIEKWQPTVGVNVRKWSIRRMKTKWGSCNRATGHIWLNLELAKKDPICLEYILVHEMSHYLERRHGERFIRIMDSYMPDWRARQKSLNELPLGHEDWGTKGTEGIDAH